MRAIALKLVEEEKRRGKANAVGFFFFLPGTDSGSFFTAGKVDWAPGGVWGDADTVSAGDYSKHRLGNLTATNQAYGSGRLPGAPAGQICP